MPADALDAVQTGVIEPTRIDLLTLIAPSVAEDPAFRAWWDRVRHRGASPAVAHMVRNEIVAHGDVRPALARVEAPVLLVARRGCPAYDVGHSAYLAENLARTELVHLDDPNDPWWLGDAGRVLDELDRFLAAPALDA
jgi:hypothetical protein